MKYLIYKMTMALASHKRIVRIALLLIFIAMFFIPFYDCEAFVSSHSAYDDAIGINWFAVFHYKSYGYIFVFISYGISLVYLLVTVFLSNRRNFYPVISFTLFPLTFFIVLLKNMVPLKIGVFFTPYMFILLIAVIGFSIAFYILEPYFAKHPVEAPPPRQPRPHKPTQAERIAELEKQVEELKNNQK